MAIVQMKKLRLMVVRSRKDELLRALARQGEVQIDTVREEDLLGDGAALTREGADVMALKSRQLAVEQAISLLNRYAPVKTPMLAPKPELEKDVFLSENGLSEAEKAAETIREADGRIKRIGAEESRQRSLIETMTPWRELDLPLQCEGTQRAAVVLGSVSAKQSMGDLQSALENACEEAELFSVSNDGAQQYLVLVCAKEALADAQEALRPFNFNPAAFSGVTGTAAENIAAAERQLKALAAGKERLWDCLTI